MNSVYISQISLKETVDYFKTVNLQNHMHLGLFLFLKYCGIGELKPICSENYKVNRSGQTALEMLCGIFDPAQGEKPGKYTCVFPFALFNENEKKSYYNGGTEFQKLVGRIKDTLDNSLITKDHYLKIINRDGRDYYGLKSNYLSIVKNYLGTENKIFIEYLASWTYRFHKIVSETNISSEQFTRILITKFNKEFNITSDEEKYLFQRSGYMIKPSNTPSTGEYFRSLINFKNKPEIDVIKDSQSVKTISLREVKEMSQPNGKNISEDKLLILLNRYKQVILFGCPGTGKTYIAKSISDQYDQVSCVQFHPSSDYESFIIGTKYNTDTDKFESREGYLLKLCKQAAENPKKRYLIVIDEINRGNLTRIFGEAIIALDREYDVNLMSETYDSFKIPDNLHILGTMNSSDRSIAFVDYALRRRFCFIRFYPNAEILRSLSDDSALDIDITLLFEEINERLRNVLKDEDLLLGQAYFLPKWARNQEKIKWNEETLQDVFTYSILPILEEYTYGKHSILEKIIGTNLSSRVSDIEEFMEFIKDEFPNIKKS